MPLVNMIKISKRFGAIKALDKVDFSVNRQEIVGLVGDNGAGKSTLIKILSGVYSPDEGEIYFEGKRVTFKSPLDAKRFGIETVYQDLALAEHLNVWRNFFLNREITKKVGLIKLLDHKTMRDKTKEALRRFEILLDSIDKPVSLLSGGERQTVSVARSFYFGAKLLILDEPVAALSIKETLKVLDAIKRIKEQGLSVIFITHNLYHIYPVADRIVVLSRGRKIADIPKHETTIEEISELIVKGK